MKISRYSIYYVPDGPLGKFGASWLGWDIQAREFVPLLHIENNKIDLSKITEEPRKYGFHGTLKAPFRLNSQKTEKELIADFEEFCRNQPSVCSEKLVLTIISNFIALAPAKQSERISQLAQNCVTFFDHYRAPLNKKELARKQKKTLTSYQQEMLSRWGYPYVFKDFKFHLTLTGKISKTVADELMSFLARKINPVLEDRFRIRELVLARQEENGMFCQCLRRKLNY